MATLPIIRLTDFLAGLPMPHGYESCAPSWRCRVAPEVDSDAEMLAYFDQGIPCFAPPSHSAPVHERVADALDFITDPRWSTFPKPKVAFHQGWAGPGTDMEDERLHTLITSFEDVFKAADSTGTILNLQYFHRDNREVHPPIPPMSEHLVWPQCLTREPGSVVCDNATRVSKRGAATWWHLDDSGEFVMQTALNNKAHQPGTQPVKIFVYGPHDSYDWTSHDARTEESGRVVSLHLFDQVSEEELPPSQYLPVFTVAVLRAGGRPLVSPPNIPHLVITCNDCVMVEQRRVSNAFLDEVAYLLRKVQHWQATPILYRYLRHDLQDHAFVGRLVKRLQARASGEVTPVERKRLLCSLLAIARFPTFFAVPGCVPRPPMEDIIAIRKADAEEEELLGEAEAEARRRRRGEEQWQRMQQGGQSVEQQRLCNEEPQTDDEEAYRKAIIFWCFEHGASDALLAELEDYWNVTKRWEHGPGVIFSLNSKTHFGVSYPNSRPLYGPPRTTPDAARADAMEMAKVSEDGGAWSVRQYLMRQKQASMAKDAVLDELF